VWILKKGRLLKNGKDIPGKVIARSKNEKTSGVTTDTCWNYGSFAVVETKSTDEVGAAEINVRHAPPAGSRLCAVEFSGRTHNLKISEGYFAGVAGDALLVDGVDASEGMLDFQIFSVTSGQEIFKSAHHPREEFSLTVRGEQTSLIYFAKVDAKCELPEEGAACWKQIVQESRIPKSTPMPTCKALVAKSQGPDTPWPLVTVRARVANLKNGKMHWLGGRAACDLIP
jgi:hypothetical protein